MSPKESQNRKIPEQLVKTKSVPNTAPESSNEGAHSMERNFPAAALVWQQPKG